MMAVPTTVVFGAMLALILVSRRKTWQCADCKLVTTTSLLTRGSRSVRSAGARACSRW
jgi:hypothetical protein